MGRNAKTYVRNGVLLLIFTVLTIGPVGNLSLSDRFSSVPRNSSLSIASIYEVLTSMPSAFAETAEEKKDREEKEALAKELEEQFRKAEAAMREAYESAKGSEAAKEGEAKGKDKTADMLSAIAGLLEAICGEDPGCAKLAKILKAIADLMKAAAQEDQQKADNAHPPITSGDILAFRNQLDALSDELKKLKFEGGEEGEDFGALSSMQGLVDGFIDLLDDLSFSLPTIMGIDVFDSVAAELPDIKTEVDELLEAEEEELTSLTEEQQEDTEEEIEEAVEDIVDPNEDDDI